jgi:hypothetical protein
LNIDYRLRERWEGGPDTADAAPRIARVTDDAVSARMHSLRAAAGSGHLAFRTAAAAAPRGDAPQPRVAGSVT